MKQLNLILITIIFFVLGLTGLQAQESFPASGGEADGGGGSVSYSVGQLVFSTYIGEDGSVAEGVQQPYEISIVVGLEEAKGIELTCTAYPNPTQNQLNLKVENFTFDNLTYNLFDINGKVIASEKVIDQITSINMSGLNSGTYFLKIMSKEKESKTFKINKN